MSDQRNCIEWQIAPGLGLSVPVLNLENEDDARQSLARVATIKSYALLEMLRREQAYDQEHGNDMFGYTFDTTMQHLIGLNTAICAAVSSGPNLESPASIADMIFGSGGWRDSRVPV